MPKPKVGAVSRGAGGPLTQAECGGRPHVRGAGVARGLARGGGRTDGRRPQRPGPEPHGTAAPLGPPAEAATLWLWPLRRRAPPSSAPQARLLALLPGRSWACGCGSEQPQRPSQRGGPPPKTRPPSRQCCPPLTPHSDLLGLGGRGWGGGLRRGGYAVAVAGFSEGRQASGFRAEPPPPGRGAEALLGHCCVQVGCAGFAGASHGAWG